MSLTQRQLEVFGLLLNGHSNKEITKTLGITRCTIQNHCRAIYGYLGVSDRKQLNMADFLPAKAKGVGR